MELDNIGRLLTTNDVHINPERVRKRFRNFALTMTWGFLERKPYLFTRQISAQQRYEREKRLIPIFYENGLNTPELINADDENLILRWKTLELTDLIHVFQDPRIHLDDKLDYFEEGLRQLHGIHNLGETHGDPYLKNMFRLNRDYPNRGWIYTCDFEYVRISPDPQVTDVLIFVADSIGLLNKYHPEEMHATLRILKEVYGAIPEFPFDARDRFFFSRRFGMGREFFDYFSSKRTLSTPT